MHNILIAKPIINDEYWILTNGKEKIGNVVANNYGVELKLNGITSHYDNINELTKENKIEFQHSVKKLKITPKPIYEEYPISGKMYNNIVDLKKRIQLYTKSLKSKCYYAAGYFGVYVNGVWSIELCPKYIFIQRYPYVGPFKTEEEAKLSIDNKSKINTL